MEIINEQFDTPEAFVKRITQRKKQWQWVNSVESYVEFSDSDSTAHALEMFARGWPERARTMSKLEDDIFAQLTTGIERIDPVHVEADGHALDVAEFVTGVPEHWVRFDTSIVEGASDKILKIAINIGALGSVDKSTIIERGTAISSLIEALEFRGYRCELWIMKVTRDASDTSRHVWKMLAKPAEQPLDLARVLFWTAHPAMLRRLHFSLLASIDNPSKLNATKNASARMGWSTDLLDTSEYDVYVPAQMDDSDPIYWLSSERRNVWLKEQIEKIESR